VASGLRGFTQRHRRIGTSILNLMNSPATSIRLGRPWIGYCIVALVVGVFSETAYIAYSLVAIGPNRFGGLPWINGLFAAVMATLDLAVVFLMFRHPTKLVRVIKLTDRELQLPDPKWRHVPISDVAGIGLGRYQPVLGSKRKGTWAPIFWRRDGTHLRVPGLGLSVSKDSPDHTMVADAICEIYRLISAAQGLNGILAVEAHQRNANLRVTESIVSIWDPSDHLSISGPA